MIVALSEEDMSAEKRTQLEALEKEMEKIDATEVSYALSRKGNFEIFGAEWHLNLT
jgi:hypothetical protein